MTTGSTALRSLGGSICWRSREAFTYGGVAAHVLTFAAHRRTPVCGALIAAGVTDLSAGDPMRWVAEHA